MSAKKRHNYRHLPCFILLVLAQHEAHGGAIHSKLIDILPYFQSDTGAIYRTLQQLEKQRAVNSAWNTEELGPARKIYRITSLGWEELAKCKEDIEKRMSNFKCFMDWYSRLVLPDK